MFSITIPPSRRITHKNVSVAKLLSYITCSWCINRHHSIMLLYSRHSIMLYTILSYCTPLYHVVHHSIMLALSSGSQIRRIGRARLPTTDYVCISADPFRSPSEGSIVGRSPRSAQQAASMNLVHHTTLSHITRTLSQRRLRKYIFQTVIARGFAANSQLLIYPSRMLSHTLG